MSAASGLLFAVGTGLLAVAIKLVCDSVFPTPGAPPLAAQLSQLPAWMGEPLRVWVGGLEFGPGSAGLKAVIGLVPVAMLFRALGNYLTTYLTHWIGMRVVHDLRVRMYGHVHGLSLDFFHRSRTGDLLSRLMSDTQALQSVTMNSLATVLRDPLTVAGLAAFLIWKQPTLTGLSLVIFPVVVAPIAIFGRKLRKSWKAAQMHTSELSHEAQETLSGARIIQAYNLQPVVAQRFAEISRRLTSQFMRFIRASELPGPMIEFAGSIGVALLLYYVATLANGKPSSGDFNSFLASLFALYQPIKNLTRLYGWCEQGEVILERADELLAEEATVREPENPKPFDASNGAIEFRNVTFAYGEKVVLRDFSFRIQPGQFVALVGPTGSGKSTLTSLLLRFHDPQSGEVSIGGVPLRQMSMVELRRQIAVVTQQTILFNDTIRSNLLLARPDAGEEDLKNALDVACAREFVEARPEGLEALVGERGVSFSGGQQQRLALARAWVKDAPVLILDEATSALDTETERTVQGRLIASRRGRTTICVAHRLTTIQGADVIVVLDGGRIVEHGTHGELLSRGGMYRRLWDLQFGGGGAE